MPLKPLRWAWMIITFSGSFGCKFFDRMFVDQPDSQNSPSQAKSAPEFQLRGVQNVPFMSEFKSNIAIDPIDGTGIFVLQFGCQQDLEDIDGAWHCLGQQIKDFRIGLEPDRWSEGLSLTECRRIAEQSGSPARVLEPGVSTTFPQGGVTVTLKGTQSLSQAKAHLRVVIAIRMAGANGGCRFHRLTVQAP